MAAGLILVALLVGGLGAIRRRRQGDAAGLARSSSPADAGSAEPRRTAKTGRPQKRGRASRSRGSATPVSPTELGDSPLAGPEDVDDLDAAFDRVLEAHSHELGILLASRLQQLVDRRVPVRQIRNAPGTSAARVCFADGTIVLARGVVPGDFVRIAWGIHTGSVWLHGFSRSDATTRLDLRWHDGSVAVVALGLDQPD